MKNKKLVNIASNYLLTEHYLRIRLKIFSVQKVFVFPTPAYLHYYILIIYDIKIK